MNTFNIVFFASVILIGLITWFSTKTDTDQFNGKSKERAEKIGIIIGMFITLMVYLFLKLFMI